MKKLIVLYLVNLVNSEESSGSIFEYLNLGDSNLSGGDLQEKAENLEVPESFDTIVYQTNQKGSASSYTELLLEESIQNDIITAQNDQIKSDLELLESQLQGALEKANAYRLDEQSKKEKFDTEVTILTNYNKGIAKDIVEDELEEGEDLHDLEASSAMVFVLGLGFLFFLLHATRLVVGFQVDNFLTPALYTLFVDVSILLVICTIVAIAFYAEFYDEYLDYTVMLAGVAFFTFFWLVLGLWLIVAAQSFATTWIKQERACQDMRALTQQFQEAQIEADNSDSRRLRQAKHNFHYAIMRQLFIFPTILPPVTEIYLRTDFDFADYLSRCMASVLESVFLLNWVGYILIILAAVAWRVIVSYSEDFQLVCLWLVPVVIIGTCLLCKNKLRKAYIKLVPEPTEEVIANLPRDNFGRTPEMNDEIVPIPEYLKGNLPPKDQEFYFVRFLCLRVHPLKLTSAYILSGSFPNRHELLFWFDKQGVCFMTGVMQAVSVVLTLWITVIILHYVPLLNDEWKWLGILATAAAVLIWVFMACYLLPETLRLFMLTTKIEMKKDRTTIQSVIINEKHQKAQTMVRIYRQFKMIYRDRYEEGPGRQKLEEHIKTFTEEVFSFVEDSGLVSIEDLETLIALCGIYLEDDELRLFAKECCPDENKCITLEGFQYAVSEYLKSARLRPHLIVSKILNTYFEEQRGRQMEDVSLEELKQFFNDYGWHFTEEDTEDFLWEARFVLEDIGSVKVSEVAGLVRNHIEAYAK